MTSFGGDVIPAAGPSQGGWPVGEVPATAPGPGQPGAVLPPAARVAMPAEALRQQAAALLQHCYHWLETAVPIMPQAAWLAPPLVTAVQQYEAEQYDACLAQTLAVIQGARQVQAAVPTLPPL